MSILATLPGYVRETIASGNPNHTSINDPSRDCSFKLPTRTDLMVIPEAEAAGWVVSFRNGSWHNSTEFKRGNVYVWQTVHDWRRATLGADNRFGKPEVFSDAREALSIGAV